MLDAGEARAEEEERVQAGAVSYGEVGELRRREAIGKSKVVSDMSGKEARAALERS